ncbi:hypothetical protein VKT23_015131 [Stygiomarasmius scandens]|uniref:Uncharacterized protein n=1 Tax=Marasmiellus scandens TaxID=2682957 RepID=A0ABR1J214_9AGAR
MHEHFLQQPQIAAVGAIKGGEWLGCDLSGIITQSLYMALAESDAGHASLPGDVSSSLSELSDLGSLEEYLSDLSSLSDYEEEHGSSLPDTSDGHKTVPGTASDVITGGESENDGYSSGSVSVGCV